MKSLKLLKLTVLLLMVFFISCNKNKTEKKEAFKKEKFKTSVRKMKKKEALKKKTIVKVKATIAGENFVFGELEPVETDVVYLKT